MLSSEPITRTKLHVNGFGKNKVNGLGENKILNFFLYITDEVHNYVMIVKGPVDARTSILIFDSDL